MSTRATHTHCEHGVDLIDGDDACAKCLGWEVPPMPEAERCALICEFFAEMLENGAGPVEEPSHRLRQAARAIREGKNLRPSSPNGTQADP